MERRLRSAWISNALPGIPSVIGSVRENLDALQAYMSSETISETTVPKEIISYVLNAKGKRIRPTIFFLVCKLLGYQGEHLLPIAAVSEYVHTASLLHDDVIDDTTLRRRKPTVNSKWGDETSILVGDLVYAHASELMTATGDLRIVSAFARAIKRMSEGELLQLENLYNINIPEEVWLQIIRYKTGELLAATCKAAGFLALADDKLCNHLYEFGLNVGVAFQLIDDTLDFAGQEKELGKQTMIDLVNGRITLPLVFLYRHGGSRIRELLKCIVEKDKPSKQDLFCIHELVAQHGSLKMTTDKAVFFTNKAVRALDPFPSSPEKEKLIELTDFLLARLA